MGERSFRASAAGVEKLSLAFKKYGKNQDYLAGEEGCTRQTVNKFLKGKRISKELFTSLCNKLKLKWQDIAELESDLDETSWTVPSMNTASVISISRTEGTGAVTKVAEANTVHTSITFDTVNGQFSITFPGDINSFLNDSKKRNDLLKSLIMISGDKNATIAKIEKGSIKITFNVSPDGFKKLEAEPNKILLVARIISRAKGEELDLSDTDLSGVDLSGVDLSGINFSCADLRNANLGNANLENADLDCADLSGANLGNANLRGTSLNDARIDDKWLIVCKIVNQFSVERNLILANLSGADLSRANLSDANLIGADLFLANLIGADLFLANLSDANLIGANLSDADLIGANLSDADLSDANLIGANLIGANLSSANLSSANLSSANLSSANLRGANLRNADLSSANLRGANLRDANLRGANLRDANLIGANLRGANLRDANLRGANLRDADLRDADLSGADLSGADLSSADLSDVKFENARFGNNPGITEDAKRELKQRGAVFEDSPGERSKIPPR